VPIRGVSNVGVRGCATPLGLREDCRHGSCEFPSRLKQRRALGALFAVLAIGFAGIAFAAAYGAGNEAAGWTIVLASAALSVWLATMAFRALR
jgi:hypothetical protein